MTNNIRLNGNASLGGNRAAAPTSANGTVEEMVVFVDVKWRWLALPALVVVGGLLVLLTAIAETRSSGRNTAL